MERWPTKPNKSRHNRWLYPSVVASGTLSWCNPNASMVCFPGPSALPRASQSTPKHPRASHALPGSKCIVNCSTTFRPCTICYAGQQKTEAAQRASHDLHRQISSRSHSFTEAKLTVSIKVMVLPQPNAKSIPCTSRPQMYCKLQH